MADARSKKIVFLAHCLLNQNAKVRGLAGYPGAFEPLLPILLKSGAGLVQLPCPEMACLGPKRPLGTDTIQQYDKKEYRAVCRRLARAAVREIENCKDAGYRIIAVLGVEGSPSCSVERAPRLCNGERRLVPGAGLFIQAILAEAQKAGLAVFSIGIPECPESGDLARAIGKLKRRLRSGG